MLSPWAGRPRRPCRAGLHGGREGEVLRTSTREPAAADAGVSELDPG